MRDSYQDNAAGTEPVEGTTEVVTEPRSLRNRWSADEDRQLVELVARRGVPASGKWAELEGTIRGRNAKQMRERWLTNLDPSLKLGPWSDLENQMLLQKFDEYGSCACMLHHLTLKQTGDKTKLNWTVLDAVAWRKIQEHLPGRTDIACRNQFNKLDCHGLLEDVRAFGPLPEGTVIEASEPAAVFDRFSGPSGNVGIAVTQTSAADNRLLGTGGSSDTNKDVYSMNVAAIAAGGISQGSPSSSASKVAHPVDGEHVSHKLEANHMGPPSASKHAGMKALDRPKLEARPVHPWDVAMKQTKDMTTAEAMQVAQQFRSRGTADKSIILPRGVQQFDRQFWTKQLESIETPPNERSSRYDCALDVFNRAVRNALKCGEGNQSAASQTKLESHDSSDKTIDAGLPEKSESKNELAAGELAAGNSGGATADGNGQVNDIPAVGDIVSVTFATDTAEGGLVTSVDVGPLKRGFTVQWPGESRTWHIDPDLHAYKLTGSACNAPRKVSSVGDCRDNPAGQREYQVRWKSYGKEMYTWEKYSPGEEHGKAVEAYELQRAWKSYTRESVSSMRPGAEIVKKHVRVFWDLDDTWYGGHVVDFNEEKREHKVLYDDGESEWVALGRNGGDFIRYRVVPPQNKDEGGDDSSNTTGGSRKKRRR